MINKKDFMLCESITKEELKNLKGDWKANIKLDGERIIAFKRGTDIFLLNRRGREKSFIYPEIVKELSTFKSDFIFDGEVITEDGKFNSLQTRVNLSDRQKIKERMNINPVIFMIFDVLSFEGEDLRNKPLKERIKPLSLIPFEELKHIGFVAYEEIIPCLKSSEEHKGEGIVIKEMNSLYESRRSKSWLKCKNFKEDVIKVVSYIENNMGIRVEDSRGIAVQIAGEQHRDVKKQIDENGYCEINIQYLEKTKDNKLRFPSYRGIKNV